MGEAKRRRELGKNTHISDPREAMKRLGAADAGTPMQLVLLGAKLIPQAIASGALMERKATTGRHLWRYAFSIWDRIRTGEYSPWVCALCGRDYSGLPMLSVFAIVDRARDAPVPSKPAAMALVCQACDSISTEETQRRIEEMFGLCAGPREGHA